MEVQTPREKLEDYFLRIVEQAQKDQLATSGAVIGAGISDFLGDREQQSATTLIDDLVTGKEADKGAAAEKTQATAVPVGKSPVRQDLLDDLVNEKPEEDLTVPVQSAEADPATDTPVDRSVIDSLLKNDKTNPDRKGEGNNEPRP